MFKLIGWVIDNLEITPLVLMAWFGFFVSLSTGWQVIEKLIYGVSQTSLVDTVIAGVLAALFVRWQLRYLER